MHSASASFVLYTAKELKEKNQKCGLDVAHPEAAIIDPQSHIQTKLAPPFIAFFVPPPNRDAPIGSRAARYKDRCATRRRLKAIPTYISTNKRTNVHFRFGLTWVLAYLGLLPTLFSRRVMQALHG